ncbi:hypothetical protein EHQ92_18055 [Leptospira biflexa]|uniref:hypothetical protein n=1 Tax=Leptospira biflexa TaxID=172 RepID=UPI00109174EE|nr:hypothetical protein [Leptospira biflexa]TGM41702.1 hypothetical protein EHQ92_18055 [Leptospira biflexa]TGM43885.1 hypothetical protein EHQ88_18105 [Leptospira biflexa]
MKKTNNTDKILRISKGFSLISFGLGILLATNSAYKIIWKNEDINSINNIYIIFGLLLVGTIGSILFELFQNILKQKTEEFLNSIEGKEFIDNEIKKILLNSNEFEKLIIENTNLISKIQHSIGFEDNQETSFYSSNTFDTVIVPAGWSYEWNMKYKLYFCQKGRSFQDVKYLAIYAHRRIWYVGHKTGPLAQNELNKYLENEEFKLSIQKFNLNLEELDFYKIESTGIKNDGKLNIEHTKRYALVLNQIYTNFQSLLEAKTTDQIKRNFNT